MLHFSYFLTERYMTTLYRRSSAFRCASNTPQPDEKTGLPRIASHRSCLSLSVYIRKSYSGERTPVQVHSYSLTEDPLMAYLPSFYYLLTFLIRNKRNFQDTCSQQAQWIFKKVYTAALSICILQNTGNKTLNRYDTAPSEFSTSFVNVLNNYNSS
jgi:hypothetical protein